MVIPENKINKQKESKARQEKERPISKEEKKAFWNMLEHGDTWIDDICVKL